MRAVESEDREFMSELLLRHERATEAMIDSLREFMAELRQEFGESRRILQDLHEASQAQTQALFRVLDRLA